MRTYAFFTVATVIALCSQALAAQIQCNDLLTLSHSESHLVGNDPFHPPGIGYREAPEFSKNQKRMAQEALYRFYSGPHGSFTKKEITIERIYKNQYPLEIQNAFNNLMRESGAQGPLSQFVLGHEYGQWIFVLKNNQFKLSELCTSNAGFFIEAKDSWRALEKAMQGVSAQDIARVMFLHTHPVALEGAEILSDKDLMANFNEQLQFADVFGVRVPFVIIAIPLKPEHDGIATRSIVEE